MNSSTVDILAFGAHPDDVELSCAGTLALHQSLGYSTAIVDLTQGEMGTRGTREIRLQEAAEAARILGVSARENLRFRDGFFPNDEDHQIAVARMIRKYRPQLVLANAVTDRHPDHGRGAELVRQGYFLAGLKELATTSDGKAQEAYRPQMLLHYIQFQNHQPDIIVHIDEHIHTKIKAIQAYASQFYDPHSKEPETVISGKNFLDSVTYRSQDMGRLIGVNYGEGFVKAQDLGIDNLLHLRGVR